MTDKIISGVIIGIVTIALSFLGKKLFTSEISIPVWLFLLILFICLASLIKFFINRRGLKYVDDSFDGIRWRWSYDFFGKPTYPFPYCPHDDTALIYSTWQNQTTFTCETCLNKLGTFSGDFTWNQNRIKRQIDRKIRNKEYILVK